MSNLNEKALNEMMLTIRRNSSESPCITNFEKLLREIDAPEFVNCVTSSMFNFMTELFELFNTVNRVPQKKFKSKMLTQEFIEPDRFFTRVRKMADRTMRLRAAIEITTAGKIITPKITVDSSRKPIQLSETNIINLLTGVNENEKDKIKELARREMLVWNYLPAVVKALIQTRRRQLGMDKNSKRFD